MDAEKKARLVALQHRIETAQHGMQAGVGMRMALGQAPDTEPKHLRVGVNSALVFNGALVALLIEKGIITQEEYLAVAATMMEGERDRYAQQLSDHFGKPVILG